MARTDTRGYYRWPTLAGERVVFVSEDDLWIAPVRGGVARRLSSGLGRIRTPAFSHDGTCLAFSSSEEGHSEIYLMPSEGGEAERLTYLGCDASVVGWTAGGEILFISNHQQAFGRLTDVYAVHPDTRTIRHIECGPASHAHFDPRPGAAGGVVISRHGGTDLAYWKRYRGGRAGEIWIDREGQGDFKKLVHIAGNTARPYWIGDRIYFLSDHEGVSQIYSVTLEGDQIKRHTDFKDFYVRGLSVCGSRLAFHAGADLYVLDTAEEGSTPREIPIDYRSPRTQTNRRFVSADDYLEDYELHPSGESAVIAARGKVFSFGLKKGPVFQHGLEGAMRYRFGRYLQDGEHVVVVSDAGGEESLEIHDAQNRTLLERLVDLELGRVVDMKLSPVADEALIVNHRNELIYVDLDSHESRVLDRSRFAPIAGFNWSPDGRYVAYGCSQSERLTALRICEIETGEVHVVTAPVLRDVSPFFDPEGNYLYFLSYREFDPVYDNLHFDLGFPRGCRPYLLTLREDVRLPFGGKQRRTANRAPEGKSEESEPENEREGSSAEVRTDEVEEDRLVIDFAGIENRVAALPVADGRYAQIAATHDKVFFTRLPIEGSLYGDRRRGGEPRAKAQLEALSFSEERVEILVNSLSSFRLSRDGKHIIYRAGQSLRVVKAGERPGKDEGRNSGWLDLERVQVPVYPRAEWRQMFREAWRLQRDHFWTESMGSVDWSAIFDRYHPLLERVACRSELSDLLWEMHGELGTSHAYEIGGDYRPDPEYGMGFLGAELSYEKDAGGYRLERVLKGDVWDESASSPLARAGLGLEEGDYLLAIDGQPLSPDFEPQHALLHKAGKEVSITYRRRRASHPETTSIKTLRSEQKLRYREWVNRNRARVHAESGGRVGYLHIPNMGPFGYSEFHRGFLQELDRDGLIVDVRYNGGGHVSQLLLEKLARRRIGYSKSRWFGVQPYPDESPAGPIVAITNEYAGSDGDIFSHAFKLLRLGLLVGKRTWGGVIGINPSHSLVDGGVTTQPEYSFWFEDVGWRVENFGTEPDIEVEFPPAAFVLGRDPQLETALGLCQGSLDRNPPKKPHASEERELPPPGF